MDCVCKSLSFNKLQIRSLLSAWKGHTKTDVRGVSNSDIIDAKSDGAILKQLISSKMTTDLNFVSHFDGSYQLVERTV